MRIRMLVIATVTLAFTTTAAQAARVYTPPLSAEVGGSHTCQVVNVSKKNRTVNIEVISNQGVVLSGSGPIILGAGQSASVGTITANRRYCRVTVKGGKKTIRVSLESRLNGDTIAAVNGF